MEEPTIQAARDLIEHMKTMRPSCDGCEKTAYANVAPKEDPSPSAFKYALAALHAQGWEHMSTHAALIRRCQACATAQMYPWADRLNAERVLAHMKTKDGVWELKELEALT